MTINLVRPCKNAIFKHFLRGDSSVTALESEALCRAALSAKYQPPLGGGHYPPRRHGDANSAPDFKDKDVISDFQQPEGAVRAFWPGGVS